MNTTKRWEVYEKTEWYDYDEEGDVLDVYFGAKRPAWTIELTPNIMISVDRTKRKAVSLTLIDYTELVRHSERPRRIWGARRFPITGLADLPIEERDFVLKILNSSPINRWLDMSAVQMLPDSPFAVTHLEPPPPSVTQLMPQMA